MTMLEEITNVVSVGLKEKGYKKDRLTWKKKKDNITVVFSIQRSQFGDTVWYYCFGIFIQALSNKNPAYSNCQIREQMDHIYQSINIKHVWSGSEVVDLVERWENRYGSIDKVRKAAIEGTLPRHTSYEAIRYLTTVDLSKYF